LSSEEYQNYLLDVAQQFKVTFPDLSYGKMLELSSFIEIIQVKKKDIIITEGRYDNRILFVMEGLFRCYFQKDETENTLWFMTDKEIMASYHSLLCKQVSRVSYQAIEDSVVAALNYDMLKEKSKIDIEIAQSIITVLEQQLFKVINALEDYIMLNSEERFIKIMDERPYLLLRVPQHQLASMLGIKAESLSRLKSRLKTKKY
jgi:CRP-like cAMP-binding protein